MNFHCPVCKSTDIIRKYYVPISKEGHLPNQSPMDYCNCCGFKSEESFLIINHREKRNLNIEKILKQDGVH